MQLAAGPCPPRAVDTTLNVCQYVCLPFPWPMRPANSGVCLAFFSEPAARLRGTATSDGTSTVMHVWTQALFACHAPITCRDCPSVILLLCKDRLYDCVCVPACIFFSAFGGLQLVADEYWVRSTEHAASVCSS